MESWTHAHSGRRKRVGGGLEGSEKVFAVPLVRPIVAYRIAELRTCSLGYFRSWTEMSEREREK